MSENKIEKLKYKSINISRSFLVNTADRIIRVYDGKEVVLLGMNGEPDPIQKLQDLINRFENK